MGKLTKKHGIKVVGGWASMQEHLIVVVYDVQNPESMMKYDRLENKYCAYLKHNFPEK